MTRYLRVVVIALAIPPVARAADDAPVLKKGGRLVIAGDSITEQKLYSRYMETYLTACHPELDLWVLQVGWSGERAPGFANRMAADTLAFKPTVMTTCYGMNDGSYQAYKDSIGDEYKKHMRTIVERAKAAGITVVVGSPGAVDLHTFKSLKPEVYNDNLSHLRDIAMKLAGEFGMPFADVHDAMFATMVRAKQDRGTEYWVCGRDGFHPGPNGQLIMAYAFLKAFKLDGTIGAVTVDMQESKAEASAGHKINAVRGGVVDLESSRYPFCHFGDPKSPDSTRSILPFLAFQKDLNRFTLTVKSLKSAKANVTWGKETKSFTREQLEKGINLTEEFADTPFAEAFQKVDALVAAKQGFETTLIKNYHVAMRGLLNEKDVEIAAAAKALVEKLHAKQAKLSADARAAVKPVGQTIRVEPE